MPRRHEPLPLEARRVLWRKVWDRLLVAPPAACDRDAGGGADVQEPDRPSAGRQGGR